MSAYCRPPSKKSILCILHLSPFLKKCALLAMCLVCLVSLPLLAIHTAHLISNIIRGTSNATRPIMGLCEGTERRGGTRVPQRWWKQPGIGWRMAQKQQEREAEAADAAGHTDATSGKKTTTDTPGSGSGKGTGEEASLGASGSSGGGMERGGRLRTTQQTTGDTRVEKRSKLRQ